MMIVQYVMECLCYLFLPIAISLFAFESTKGLAIRYLQQTLAIFAWPIGFAVVDLVGYQVAALASAVLVKHWKTKNADRRTDAPAGCMNRNPKFKKGKSIKPTQSYE